MRDGKCFTDGLGNISNELAALIDKKFGIKYCSAYQVRIGGLKGVFMRNHEISNEKLIQFRPSQDKFKSNDTKLEVIRCATYSQGFLNR